MITRRTPINLDVAESHTAIMQSCFEGESRLTSIRTAIAPTHQIVV
jgi:hypothetical protein